MKTTYKIGLGLMLFNILFVFCMANAQEKAPVTAKQIKDGTVPGLKYGPKKKDTPPPSDDKQKNYKGGDSKAYLFTDYKQPQQGLRRAAKQATAKSEAPAKLTSEAEKPAKGEEKKAETPKAPPMQNEGTHQ